MTIRKKTTTVYLDPVIHTALKKKASETSRSLSDLVNEVLERTLAEDAEDLSAFEQRADEPLLTYDKMLKRPKDAGWI